MFFSFDEIMLDPSSMDGLPLRDQDQGQAPSQKPLQESRQEMMVMCTTALVTKWGVDKSCGGMCRAEGIRRAPRPSLLVSDLT